MSRVRSGPHISRSSFLSAHPSTGVHQGVSRIRGTHVEHGTTTSADDEYGSASTHHGMPAYSPRTAFIEDFFSTDPPQGEVGMDYWHAAPQVTQPTQETEAGAVRQPPVEQGQFNSPACRTGDVRQVLLNGSLPISSPVALWPFDRRPIELHPFDRDLFSRFSPVDHYFCDFP
uniref:Uncharacterized protein n=1 Tax=Oryza sativa subsp. japonica TaxID=39947 RepID=Q10SS8_ORYSJ|nr:hypothetical protein LOC_Os03g02130 [Oryza sativa Japonica Group]